MKINLRSMFSSIFNKSPYDRDMTTTQFRQLNSCRNYFFPFDGNAYDDATARTCIDAIAKNAAKLRPAHVRRQDGKITTADSALNSLLAVRPNEYMSSYDFLYKMVSQLYSYNNAFAYIKFDAGGNIAGIYPINYNSIELREYEGQLYCRFAFNQAGQITVPYENLIHLRRHYNRNDIFGESNERPLHQPLNILCTLKQALENAVKNCTKLRGYLKIVGNLREEDQQKALESFTEKFKKTGIGVSDAKTDYKPISSDIQTADYGQMKFAREDIYRYYEISEKIITAAYNEEEWTAFYESVIEPIAIQLSQEFTAKLFTEREKGFGNEVVFLTNRLEYASLKAKTSMAQVLQQTGIFTINEFREIFGYNAVEDGDKRFVSLNFVNAQKQDKYQVGEDDNKKEDEENAASQ